MPNNPNFRAFFVVPPAVQLLDISGPAHLFYEAKAYGATVENIFLSLTNSAQEASCSGLFLGNLKNFEDFILGPTDWVFLPGLESGLLLHPDFQKNNLPFYNWLNQQYNAGSKICSVCTGAYLSAQAGLLTNKECTTHWKFLEDFTARYPKARVLKDRLIVKDGNLYSSAGVSSGIDLALYLLEEAFGPVFASKIAKEVVIFLRRTENDPQLSVFLQYRNHIENRIHKVQDTLAQTLHHKSSIEKLAGDIHMSPRNLTRLFKKTTGITIGNYLDKLRVEKALRLLSEGEQVDVISNACGLSSSNQLRTLLKKYTDQLPSQLRP